MFCLNSPSGQAEGHCPAGSFMVLTRTVFQAVPWQSETNQVIYTHSLHTFSGIDLLASKNTSSTSGFPWSFKSTRHIEARKEWQSIWCRCQQESREGLHITVGCYRCYLYICHIYVGHCSDAITKYLAARSVTFEDIIESYKWCVG